MACSKEQKLTVVTEVNRVQEKKVGWGTKGPHWWGLQGHLEKDLSIYCENGDVFSNMPGTQYTIQKYFCVSIFVKLTKITLFIVMC